jgi:tricorn protease interacting factor F2/3
MMHSWIGQPGHPLIKAARHGDTLILSQERFTYLPAESDQKWIIPLTLTTWNHDGQSSRQAMRLDNAADEVQLPTDCAFYKLNNNQTGFFRTHYADENNLKALGQAIEEGILDAEDRWGIQNDLYAMVRCDKMRLGDYLSFLDHYVAEKAYLPMASICGHLGQAFIIVPEDQQGAVAKKGRTLALGALERITYLPSDKEPFTSALLRDQLLWQAALWDAEDVQNHARRQFQAMTAGKPVHADIAKSVMQTGALLEGESALNWLMRRFGQSPSEHERLNILTALGAFRHWPLIEKALTFTLDKVPPRNRFLTIAAAAVNPCALPHLWPWYRDHLADLEAFHPLLYERVITSVWPYAGLAYADEVHQFGEQYIKDQPQLADAAKLALENLAINQQMRNAQFSG